MIEKVLKKFFNIELYPQINFKREALLKELEEFAETYDDGDIPEHIKNTITVLIIESLRALIDELEKLKK